MNVHLPYRLMTAVLFFVLLTISAIPSRQLQANPRIHSDIAQFYDALKPYGVWVSHRTYGNVWYPTGVPQNWRPYTDGHWAYTQQYGWLWVSDQPWGWAPFHYGRWAWDNWYGWIWVPGRTWAPAWVFWRSGGGYAAWAPMPPNVLWQPNDGLNTRYFNDDRDLNWDCWVAVPEYNLPHRHLHHYIFAPDQNRHIIPMTSTINNLTVINQSIVNQGVPVTRIEQITGTAVTTVVPVVNENIEKHSGRHHKDDRPVIIRPSSADISPPEELRKHEELAAKLDQQKVINVPPPISHESHLNGTDNQEQPRIPGRLNHEHSSHVPHQGPSDPTRPEINQPADQLLSDPVTPSVRAIPQDQTSAGTLQPEFINQPVNPDMAPEALRPSDTEAQPASLPVSAVNLTPPHEQAPARSSGQKHHEPQPQTTSVPGFQDQQPIEVPPPEPLREQEPPVQMPEEPIVNQQAIQPIQPEKISGQEISQPIQTDLPTKERPAEQDLPIQPAVEAQSYSEPVRVEVPPFQAVPEPIADQQPIQQQETSHQEAPPVPAQTDIQQLNPVMQESQIEQSVQTTQPEPVPAPQPEVQTQPAIDVQPQPEPPHPEAPPAPQPEANTQPKNPCQPTEQNNCSK